MVAKPIRGESGNGLAYLGYCLRAPADGNEEHDAFAGGMRREKLGDVIVEERQTRCAQTQRVGCQVELAPNDRRVELRHAITAVAQTREERLKIAKNVDVHAGVSRQFLTEPEMASLGSEGPCPH